jgi:hypothetical protein
MPVVVKTTATTTTASPATNTTTTSSATVSNEAVTQPSTPSLGVTHAHAEVKHSAAPAQNSVSYALMCVAAMLTWELTH